MSKSFHTRAFGACIAVAACAVTLAPAAHAANPAQLSGAIFTSELDAGVFGTDYAQYPAKTAPSNCASVNTNIYPDKRAVYLNGGPGNGQNNNLPDGNYYVQVTEPSSGASPVVLGTSVGTADEQPAAVEGGLFSFCYQVWSLVRQPGAADPGFADTSNPGGEYKVYISTEPTFPNDESKTDNFKVVAGPPEVTPQQPLTIAKTATPSWHRDYDWSFDKSLVGDAVRYPSGTTAMLAYELTATKSAPTDGYEVDGTITVANPNATGDATGVTVTEDGLGDLGASCTIGGDAATYTGVGLAAGGTLELTYHCEYSAAPTVSPDVNSATVSWNAAFSDGSTSDATSTTATSPAFTFATEPNVTTDDCTDVSDAFNGGAATLVGSPCVTTTIAQQQSVPVLPNLCVAYRNDASAVDADSATAHSDSASVTVCGPQVDGRTIGFWQNPNGQSLINNNCVAVRASLVARMISVTNGSKLPTITASTSCTKNNKGVTPLGSAVNDVIKAADASGASMAAMLRAQLMATSLSAHFSASLSAARISLAKICTAVGSCTLGSGPYFPLASVQGALATPNDALTVSQLVDVIAGKDWAVAKSTQEIWKNIADTLNNNKATIAP